MITVVGEAVLDLVAEDGDRSFAAHPGGSPTNVAVGLARLGTPAALATQLGDDVAGRRIADHVADSGVDLQRLPAYTTRTSLALAAVDEKGVADYDFHIAWDITAGPTISADCVCVHTGSLATALQPGARIVDELITSLRGHSQATISYDPNIRPAMLGERDFERVQVERQVAQSDIVKVSAEDVAWLYPAMDPHVVARKWAADGPALVVLTRGPDGAYAVTSGGEVTRPAPAIEVIDTVGAGDAFMAGLLDAHYRADLLAPDQRPRLQTTGTEELAALIDFAIRTAAITCQRPGANPPTRAELA